MKYTLFVITMFCFVACHDSLTIIRGCCEEPAVSITVGLGSVFVPNVFTPNGDQLNDHLVIYGDSMRQIVSMKIKNSNNDLVFYMLNFGFNDHQIGWDGSFAGKITRGMYTYEMDVESIDGYVKTIKGKVCICPCMEEGVDLVPIGGCEFGICYPGWIDCDPNESLPCFK